MNWTDLSSIQKSEQAIELTAKGYSYSQAAEALGTTRTAVAGAIDRARMRAGSPRPNRQPSQAGKTAMQRGSTAIAQEKARRARAKKHAGLTRYVSLDEPIAAIDTAPLKSKAWVVLDGATPVSLADHRDGQCRWPHGEGPFTYCGLPVQPGKPYCTTHFALGNRPVVQGTPKRVAPKPKTMKGMTS
jgi:GcrA cell cycle regulator